jgi:anti-anti-sigma factor
MVRAHEQNAARRLARASAGRRPWWTAHAVPRRPVSGLDWESSGARAIVLVSGELGPRLEALLADDPLAGCRELELDLTGVPSMGSVGLSVLLGVRRWTLQRGIALRVRGVQPSVWRVVELAGLDQVFTGAVETPTAPAQDLALF